VRKDRDTIITEGKAAHERSMNAGMQKGPWLYYAKVKSGHRSTRNVEDTFTSLKHLYGELVQRYARENEMLNIYGIGRVMKAQIRSYREDI
jgi:hypothetical protein